MPAEILMTQQHKIDRTVDGYLRAVARGSRAPEKLPMIADLDVFILIDYCADPIDVRRCAAPLASSARSPTAHRIDDGPHACPRLKG